MLCTKALQQPHKLPIHNHTLDVRPPQDVAHVLRFKSIVDRHNHSSGGINPEDAFQKRRRVGGHDPHPPVPVLQQVVRQPPCAVGELLVRPAKHAVVGGDVVDRFGPRLDGGGAGEEVGWGEGVYVGWQRGRGCGRRGRGDEVRED